MVMFNTPNDKARGAQPDTPEGKEPSLRFCKACGKHVLERCLYRGCPIQ